MEFKGIIFDMDGVLVDSMPSHAEKLKVLCERYNSQHWDGDVGRSLKFCCLNNLRKEVQSR